MFFFSSSSSSAPSDPPNALLYKRIGIVGLVISQTTMPLMVRASRDRDNAFIITVNVLLMDLIKLAFSASLLIVKERSVFRFLWNAKRTIIGDPLETAKVCFPALLYILQNNLYYIALSNLESTTFLVAYQLKILTTAIMLRQLLKKVLSPVQWVALIFLVIGVSIVQSQYDPPAPRSSAVQSPLIGFIAVFSMCFTSSFAGVYLELVLKRSSVDVWMQNIRLALFGIIISSVIVISKDKERVLKEGFFIGYDLLVWLMTINNSVGGLLIALVIKYADNIMKAYAQATSILGAAIGSWLIFNFVPNRFFALGTTLVAISVYLYNGYPPQRGGGGGEYKKTLIEMESEDTVEDREEGAAWSQSAAGREPNDRVGGAT